jgi:hypothetical protein
MIEVLVCPKCGTQFESNGPGSRCPVCNSRGESRNRRGSGAAYFFSSNGGGLRAMSWGGGRGLLLAIASVIAAPFLASTGIIALAIGGIFDVAALVTIGLVLMTFGLVLFVFFLWKLWRGLRGAARAFQGMTAERPYEDDGRIDGRWGNTDSP